MLPSDAQQSRRPWLHAIATLKSLPFEEFAVVRYGGAAAAAVVALALCLAIHPWLGRHGPFLPFFPAIILAARFGRGPSLATTALSTLGAWYFLIEPQESFDIVEPAAAASLVLFTVTGTIVSLLIGKLRETLLSRVRSEQRFRELFESIDEGFATGTIVCDDEGRPVDLRFVRVNPAFAAVTGLSAERVIGQRLRDVIPAIEPFWIEAYGRVVLTGRSERIAHDMAVLGKHFDVFAWRSAPGAFACVITDATERQRAEADQRLLASIVHSSDDAIVGEDLNGIIISWNPAAERLFGYKAEEMRGRTVACLVPPDRQADIEVARAHMQQGESVVHCETVRETKDGRRIDVALTISPILSAAGVRLGMSRITRDITAHRRTEALLRQSHDQQSRLHEALQASAQHFRAIFDHAGIGFLELDLDGRVMVANERTGEILGYERNELTALTVHDLTAPEDQPLSDELNAALRAGTRERIEYEKRFVRRDGSRVWAHVTASTIRDSQRRLLGMIGTILDIGDRKASEARLRVSLEEKEVLLREVHHRVKNNLAVISSLLSLQSNQCSDAYAAGILQACQDRVRSMALVHESLYRSTNMAAVEFSAYVHSLADQLVILYQRPGATIRLALDIPPIELPIDQAITCGLMVNELVTNAMKHAFPDGRSGQLTLSGRLDPDGRCELLIRDDGVGLKETNEPGGSGTLGLRLIRALASQLDAELSIRRVEPGTEARVSFLVEPLKQALVIEQAAMGTA